MQITPTASLNNACDPIFAYGNYSDLSESDFFPKRFCTSCGMDATSSAEKLNSGGRGLPLGKEV